MTEIRVEGLTEIRQALLTLPDKLQGKATQAALAKAARVIVKDAQARVPQKTGRLRRAIYSFRDKASTRAREARLITVRSGKRHQKSDRDAFYWKWVEFGHAIIRAKQGTQSLGTPKAGFFGKEVRAVPARPFLRPAFETQKMKALEIFRQSMAGEIVKVAERAARRSASRLGFAIRRTFAGF